MTEHTEQDAVRFLKSQHDQVRELFGTIGTERGDRKRDDFETLVRLLAVHETAEEMVVYPVLRSGGEEANRIAEKRLAEEDTAKKLLADLEQLDPASDEFATQFSHLRAEVEAHAMGEEHEVFPLIARITDEQMLTQMTSALKLAEAMAPTHPHKLAPESAMGNILVGPFVAVVDRVRDAFRDGLRETKSGDARRSA